MDDASCGDLACLSVGAFHIAGHTPGFTAYLWLDVLFACDYAFAPDDTMRRNPYRDRVRIVNRGRRLRLVAGYSFIADGKAWTRGFEAALERTC